MAELNVPFLRRWVMWAAVRSRSLWNSRGNAGPSDIPQVLLIAIVPGLFVLFGGAIVFLLLCGWFVIEAITMALLALLQRSVPPIRTRTKPAVRPRLRWSS